MGGRQIRSASTSPLDDDELRELFEQADLNGDGALDDRECNGLCDAIRMFHGLRTPLTEEFYAIVLDELDPDETGRIYLDDLKELYHAVWDERKVGVLNPEAPSPEIADEEEARAREALEALVAELPPATPVRDSTRLSQQQLEMRPNVTENAAGEEVGDVMSEESVEEGVAVVADSARKTLWSETDMNDSNSPVSEEGIVEEVEESSHVDCETVVETTEKQETDAYRQLSEGVVDDEALESEAPTDGECSSKEAAEKLPSCCVTCGRRTSTNNALLNGREHAVVKSYKILGDVPISFFTSQYNTHPWVFGQYDSPLPPQAYVSYQNMSGYHTNCIGNKF